MTDGDVSHSSEIRLLGWRTDVGLDLCSHWISFVLCLLVQRLVLFRLLFPYQWASSPELVKSPPLREEDYFCFSLLLCLLAFYDVKLVVFVACMYFVHIAFMADGR
jgi:hypothetical protein